MAKGKPRTLLIDGDILFYKASVVSAGSVQFDPGVSTAWVDQDGAIRTFEQMMSGFLRKANFTSYFVCLSDHHRSFRKDLEPTYKQSRNGFEKPKLLQIIEDYAVENHPTLSFPRLEADDVMGIHATSGEHLNPVIVSADKDLRQIPGEHLTDGKVRTISQFDGDVWHMTQTLTGDPTDGYKGLPGCGPVSAARILDALDQDNFPRTVPEMWSRIVAAYEKAGKTEADALLQARLARILQTEDYRRRDDKIKLWKPPA